MMEITCNSHTAKRFLVSWTEGVDKYHLWVRHDRSIEGRWDWFQGEFQKTHETLYKQRLNARVSQLNFNKKVHAARRDKVLKLIESTDFDKLIEEAKQADVEKEAEKRKDRAKQYRNVIGMWAVQEHEVRLGTVLHNLPDEKLLSLARNIIEA